MFPNQEKKDGAKPEDKDEEKDPKEGKKKLPPFMAKGEDEEEDADKKKKKLPPFMAKGDEKDVEKSQISVTEEALMKSADALEALARSGVAGRKQELLKKALNGACNEDETAELSQLLKGRSDVSIAEEIEKSMSPDTNSEFKKSIDVSKYLSELHKSVSESLSTIAQAVEKSDSARSDQIVVIAKATSDLLKSQVQTMRMVKQLQKSMDATDRQPVRGPKALGAGGQPMEKSFAGGAPQGDQLSKSDVLDTLEALFRKSMTAGEEGIASTCGEKYDEAISKFEQFNAINPALLREVVAYRKSQTSGRA